MALVDIAADIHAQLVLIDANFAAAQTDPLVGAVYLNENAAPPRVVWVPLRAAPGRMDARGLAPRSIGMTRHFNAACHIWGADTASAELLLNEVHNAARRSLGSGARWTSEEWPQQSGDAIAQAGTLVIVVFEFHIPITELGQKAVTVTATQQTTEMDFPDGQQIAGTPST